MYPSASFDMVRRSQPSEFAANDHFATEEDIGSDAQVLGEIQFLMNQADAGPQCFGHTAKVLLVVVE